MRGHRTDSRFFLHNPRRGGEHGGSISLDRHVHDGVQTGGGSTGTPQ
ncbi:hypothetical protein [Bombella mellum]